jgi:hypothetical protein
LADYGINLNIGLKHLQTHLNVFAQLPVRVNVTIALLTALNIVAPLITLSIPRFNLCALIIFLFPSHLLKMHFLSQMIPLLYLL